MLTTTNVDFDTDILRYSYQSLATPSSVIDFNMKTKEKKLRREEEVLGGKFDKNNYIEERVWATATDGTKVPISMVYKRIKTGKTHCCFMRMVRMELQWIRTYRHVCLF
jgi:oligopeptidase B